MKSKSKLANPFSPLQAFLNRINWVFLRLSLKNKIVGGYALALGIAVGGTTTGLTAGNYYQQQASASRDSANQQGRLLSDLQVALLETLPTKEFVPLLRKPTDFGRHKSQLPLRAARIKPLIFELQSSPQTTATKDLDALLHKGSRAAEKFYQQLEVVLNQVEPLTLQPESAGVAKKLITNFTGGREFGAIASSAYELTPFIKTAREQEYQAQLTLIKAESLRNQIIAISMMLSILSAALLAFFTSRAIAGPIEAVTQVAQRVSYSSDFTLQVPVTTKDEIGLLATSFNNLIQTIAAYIQTLSQKNQQLQQAEEAIRQARDELEIRVRERTAELAKANQELQTEVTERQQAEKRLQNQLAFTKTITQNLGEGIYALNRDGYVTFMNPAAEQMLGWKEAELLGQQMHNIIQFQHADGTPFPAAECHLLGVLRSGITIHRDEDVFTHKDGTIFPVAYTSSPIVTDEQIVGAVLAFHDITKFKRSQEELTSQNLALQEAQKQAEIASQAKSAFLANMSHEIRTPMNAVMGMTGLLLDSSLTEEQRDFLETIRVSGDTLLCLINEILDLSKLEAGEMDLEVLDFELSSCIEDLLDLLAPQAHAKGLEIAALVEHHLNLQGDASRLRQILMNLISNAIKFTKAGEVVVQAQLLSQTPTTAKIRFTVKDTGLGIAPEDTSKLFSPFTQVDASITRRYGGTGLGLAICKQLVTLMGGEIGVESQLGIGSNFWFELPFTKQQQLVGPIQNVSYLSNRRLLVVDDNATNRKVVRHQVQRWGMQVDEAESAAAALIALQATMKQRRPYDIALIDMQMPQTDGMTLGEQIKANSALAGLPLIMFTSTNQRDEVQRALKIGFAAYLVKPVKSSRFFDTIMSILGPQPEPYIGNTFSNKTLATTKPPQLAVTTAQPKLRLLLAEDNLVNQKVAIKQLESMGYTADVAANGQEVLQLLEKIPYDLVLMDCQMPIKDGFETTREIHRRSNCGFAKGRRPVVVAMTANAMKEDQQKCLDVGMDDYLTKPVLKANLAVVLEHWSNKLLTQTMS